MTRRAAKEKAWVQTPVCLGLAPLLRGEQDSGSGVHHGGVDMRFEAGEIGDEHASQALGLAVICRLVGPGFARIEDSLVNDVGADTRHGDWDRESEIGIGAKISAADSSARVARIGMRRPVP